MIVSYGFLLVLHVFFKCSLGEFLFVSMQSFIEVLLVVVGFLKLKVLADLVPGGGLLLGLQVSPEGSDLTQWGNDRADFSSSC